MAKVSYGRRVSELAEHDPDAVAFVCGEHSLRRGALEARTHRRARRYAERGVGAGDLVTLALPASLLVGYTVQCWANIQNVHTHSGMNVGMGTVWRSMLGQRTLKKSKKL